MSEIRPLLPRPAQLLRDTWRDFRTDPRAWFGITFFVLVALGVNAAMRLADRVRTAPARTDAWLSAHSPWNLAVEGISFSDADLPRNFRGSRFYFEVPDRRVSYAPDPWSFNVWRALNTIWIPRTGDLGGEVEVTWKASAGVDGALRLEGEMVPVRKPNAPIKVVLYHSCALVGPELVRMENEAFVDALWRNARKAHAYLVAAGAPLTWSLSLEVMADDATEEEVRVGESEPTVAISPANGEFLN